MLSARVHDDTSSSQRVALQWWHRHPAVVASDSWLCILAVPVSCAPVQVNGFITTPNLGVPATAYRK